MKNINKILSFFLCFCLMAASISFADANTSSLSPATFIFAGGNAQEESVSFVWDFDKLYENNGAYDRVVVSGWYTSASDNEGEQIAYTVKDGNFVYDTAVNTDKKMSSNAYYHFHFGKGSGSLTDIMPEFGTGVYTLTVPFKFERSLGNGLRICYHSSYGELAIINVRNDGYLESVSGDIISDSPLVSGNMYYLDIVIDNTDSELTYLTYYLDGSLCTDESENSRFSMTKRGFVQNMCFRFFPSVSNKWVDMRVEMADVVMQKGEHISQDALSDCSLEVENGRLKLIGAPDTKYSVRFLKPKDTSDNLKAFEDSYSHEDFEDSDSPESLVEAEYDVTTDSEGAAYVDANFPAFGKFTALIIGNPDSAIGVLANAEALIASAEEYADSDDFIGIIQKALDISADEASDLIFEFESLSDKSFALSCDAYPDFEASVRICTLKEILFGEDFSNLKTAAENARDAFEHYSADSSALDLVGSVNNPADIADYLDGNQTPSEFAKDLLGAVIVSGINSADSLMTVRTLLDYTGSERYINADDETKFKLASQIYGNYFESLEFLVEAVESAEISDFSDDSENDAVVAANVAGFERLYNLGTHGPNDLIAGWYSGTSEDTTSFPLPVYEGDTAYFSTSHMSGSEGVNGAFVCEVIGNTDLTPIIPYEYTQNDVYTVSFDAAIKNAYAGGFALNLRYAARAGTYRGVTAMTSNYAGVVVSSGNTWLTAKNYIEVDKTYHYAVVVDQTGGTIDVYVDGQYLGSGPYAKGDNIANNTLYGIEFKINPVVNSAWAGTDYEFKNLAITQGKDVTVKDYSLSLEDESLVITAAPDTDFEYRIFKPSNLSSIIRTFDSSYTPEDYSLIDEEGENADFMLADSGEVTTDSSGSCTLSLPTLSTGMYTVTVGEKGNEEFKKLAIYNKIPKLLEINPEDNISDPGFAALYSAYTGEKSERGEEITQIFSELSSPLKAAELSENDMKKLYASVLLQGYLEGEKDNSALREKIVSELGILEISTEGIDLIKENNNFKEAADAVDSVSCQTLEELAGVMHEKAILCGVKNALVSSESEIFLSALGNTKFDKASKSEKNQIMKAVAKESFESLDELNDAIDDVRFESDNGGGGGSSSSRPSGVPSSGITVDAGASQQQSTTEAKTRFTDVPASHWAYQMIEQMAQKGIITGYDGIFRPEENVTRAEFVKMLMETFELDSANENAFSDVPEGKWYYGYVGGAKEKELINGYDGSFMPDSYITREDACVMLVRFAAYAAKLEKGTLSEISFEDWTDISDYALEAVSQLTLSGVINGYNGYFNPKDNLTRAQAAKIISAFAV